MNKLTKGALCIFNRGYLASLELGRVYPYFGDMILEAENVVKIMDEDGGTYLFPASWFLIVSLPGFGTINLV